MATKGTIKLIVAFVGRGEGKEIAKFLQRNQIEISFHSLGRGTATSELMDVLGLGSSQKDVILALSNAELSERVHKQIGEATGTAIRARGIVFSLPITGLNNMIATILNTRVIGSQMGAFMEIENQENSLILIAVNQGFTDEVMDTARAAGATGGTIIKARFSGEKESAHLYGIQVQAEKEIIAIVSPTKLRNVIMETVNRKHGQSTDASAILLSLGIDQLVRV
ncbi:MAG: hypothetical protein LBM69_03205 [Lachnospiraceae bacterium]|jgi:hypothetical protein|nr:hypothetical protein [Lachnospiraceae bacterium]